MAAKRPRSLVKSKAPPLINTSRLLMPRDTSCCLNSTSDAGMSSMGMMLPETGTTLAATPAMKGQFAGS